MITTSNSLPAPVSQKFSKDLLSAVRPEPKEDCPKHPMNRWAVNKIGLSEYKVADPYHICYECAIDEWDSSEKKKEMEGLYAAVKVANRMRMNAMGRSLKSMARQIDWLCKPCPTIVSSIMRSMGGLRNTTGQTLRMRRYNPEERIGG